MKSTLMFRLLFWLTCPSFALVAAPVSFEFILKDARINEGFGRSSLVTSISADERTFVGPLYAPGYASFRWTLGETLENLGTPSNFNQNDRLNIVRCSGDAQTIIGDVRAVGESSRRADGVRWREGSGWSYLPFTPLDINPEGSVIVGIQELDDATSVAVVSTNWASPVILARPPGTRYDYFATHVSADGRVIYGDFREPNGEVRSLVRWVDGMPSVLPPIPKYPFSRLSGISSSGDVAVGYAFSRTFIGHAYRIRGSQPAELLSSFSNPGGEAIVVSDDGGIVAGTTSFGGVAIWNDSGAVRSLSDILIVDGGLTNFNGSLTNYYGYNNYGLWVIGLPIALRMSNDVVSLYGDRGWRATFPITRPKEPVPLQGGNMLDERPGFRPQIRFKESYREAKSKNSTRTTNGSCSITISASNTNVSLSSITADTVVSVALGDFQHSARLGESLKYRPGVGSVTFPLFGALNGQTQKVGQITYRWSKTILTITATSKDPHSYGIAWREQTRWHGPAKGWVPVQISFGGDSGKRAAVYFSGKGTMSYLQKYAGPNPTENAFPSVTLSGSEKNVAE